MTGKGQGDLEKAGNKDNQLTLQVQHCEGSQTSSVLQDTHKYIKLQKIAEGSYGVVYRSVNAYTNQPIAIKKFKNSLNEGLPTSFIRELSVLKQLQGQHTVRLLDIDTTHQDPELIMEWIDTSMANLLARNDSPPELRRELVRQILTGVVQVHAKCLIHRDLKPGNIMVRMEEGAGCSVKIIDFGMARQVSFGTGEMTNEIGSLQYRAPQLLLGANVYSQQIDVWSAGCIMYEVLTGRKLFAGESELAQLHCIFKVRNQEVPSFDSLPRKKLYKQMTQKLNQSEQWEHLCIGLLPQQMQIIRRMVALDPNKRITSAEALQLYIQ